MPRRIFYGRYVFRYQNGVIRIIIKIHYTLLVGFSSLMFHTNCTLYNQFTQSFYRRDGFIDNQICLHLITCNRKPHDKDIVVFMGSVVEGYTRKGPSYWLLLKNSFLLLGTNII